MSNDESNQSTNQEKRVLTSENLSAEDRRVVNAAQKAALAILESVRDAGELGLPSGHLYVALASKGCSMQRYENMLMSLRNTGMVKRDDECVSITPAGLAAIDRLKAEVRAQPH